MVGGQRTDDDLLDKVSGALSAREAMGHWTLAEVGVGRWTAGAVSHASHAAATSEPVVRMCARACRSGR